MFHEPRLEPPSQKRLNQFKVVVPGCMEQMAVSDRHDASKNLSEW